MIEAIISLLALVGFDNGQSGDPSKYSQLPESKPEMIRAIDSVELKGFDNLEVQQADEWFV